MRITSGNVIRLSAVGLMALMLGVAGCKSSGDRTTGQKWSDRQVAKSVEKELSRDPSFKYNDVQVNVYDGYVQLVGFVETPEQRTRAAELAAQTKGVKQVNNEILLKGLPTGPATIRDPFGHETGRLMLNTNAPAPQKPNEPNAEPSSQPQEQ